MKDQRTINAKRNDPAHESLLARRRTLRAEQLVAARLFFELDASAHFVFSGAHFVFSGCANIREFGERNGFSSREAAVLSQVGLALTQIPELEQEVLVGTVSLENAAVVGRALGNPDLKDSPDEWMLRAKTMTAPALERFLKKRLAETRVEEGEEGPFGR